jgi:hypothetical protein
MGTTTTKRLPTTTAQQLSGNSRFWCLFEEFIEVISSAENFTSTYTLTRAYIHTHTSMTTWGEEIGGMRDKQKQNIPFSFKSTTTNSKHNPASYTQKGSKKITNRREKARKHPDDSTTHHTTRTNHLSSLPRRRRAHRHQRLHPASCTSGQTSRMWRSCGGRSSPRCQTSPP